VNVPDDAFESALRNLFERQASMIPVAEAPRPRVVPTPSPRTRGRRPGVLVGVAMACVIALAFGSAVSLRWVSGGALGLPGDEAADHVHFVTPQVSFNAESVHIDANGMQFSPPSSASVNSDPGTPTYWTLELIWPEHGVEMRMFVYFTSDGRDWWANEIRTYNGRAGDAADWTYYRGSFFRSPIGRPFVGDLNLTDTTSGNALHLNGLTLSTTPKAFDCTHATSDYFIWHEALAYPETETNMANNRYYVSVLSPTVREARQAWGYLDRFRLLSVHGCFAEPDAQFEWVSADPTIATVTPTDCGPTNPASPSEEVAPAMSDACRRGEFPTVQALRTGETTIHGSARTRPGGPVVATTDLNVIATPSPG
jgi:hypothetical protein